MTQITMTQRFGRAALIGMAGGAVAFAIMMSDSMFRTDYGFMRAAVMGAFLAGLLVARGFGGQGSWGWFCAGASFAAATVMGAVFAVPLMFLDEMLVPEDLLNTLGELVSAVRTLTLSTVLGPAYVVVLIFSKLMVLKAWLAFCLLIHLLVIGGSLRARSNP